MGHRGNDPARGTCSLWSMVICPLRTSHVTTALMRPDSAEASAGRYGCFRCSQLCTSILLSVDQRGATCRLFASLGVTGARRPQGMPGPLCTRHLGTSLFPVATGARWRRGVPGPMRTRDLGSSLPSVSRERVGRVVCLTRYVRRISVFRLPRRHGSASAARRAWPAAYATSRFFTSLGVTVSCQPGGVPGPLRTRHIGSLPPSAAQGAVRFPRAAHFPQRPLAGRRPSSRPVPSRQQRITACKQAEGCAP